MILRIILYFILACYISMFITTSCESDIGSKDFLRILDFTTVEAKSVEQGNFSINILDFLNGPNLVQDQILSLKKSEGIYYILTINQGAMMYRMGQNDSLYSLTNYGKGPEEVIYPSDIGISSQRNYITITDPGNRKLVTYDKEGKLIKEIIVNQWVKNGALINESEMIFAGITNGSGMSESEMNFKVLLFDSKGTVINRFSRFYRPYQAGMGNGLNLYRIDENTYGYYSMFTNNIYRLNTEGLEPYFQFNLSKPILPDSLIFPQIKGEVGLDEYVYFLSYFESNDHLVLTYELDRIKYWSIYDKQNQSIQNWFIDRKEECGTCNKIRIIGIDGSNLFAVVSSQMLELIADAQLTDSLKITIKNYEYQDFVIKLEI